MMMVILNPREKRSEQFKAQYGLVAVIMGSDVKSCATLKIKRQGHRDVTAVYPAVIFSDETRVYTHTHARTLACTHKGTQGLYTLGMETWC